MLKEHLPSVLAIRDALVSVQFEYLQLNIPFGMTETMFLPDEQSIRRTRLEFYSFVVCSIDRTVTIAHLSTQHA
jgi:hypothetical protein